jgi:ATP-dependent helicase HrpB
MQVPPEAARTAMLEGIRELGIEALPWDDDARELQGRIEFVRRVEQGSHPEGRGSQSEGRGSQSEEPSSSLRALEARGDSWPDVSNAALAASAENWLGPWLDGVTRRDHLARLRLADILKALLSWDEQRKLEELAPTHLKVPSGSNIRIDYRDENAPVVSVRLQEVFGLAQTPRLARNRVPITFKLLSPAHRPVQVTRDLASFWSRGYAEVRKDLRGRYPKHYWPENPLEAEATRGVRRRT